MKEVLCNLKSLYFKNCPGSDWKHACVINACKNLQHLSIFNDMHGTSDKLLTYIAHESSKLVKNMTKLGDLTKLTNLVINCHNYRIGPALDALVTKDLLHNLMLISVCPYDEMFASTLSNFSNLGFVFSTVQRIPDDIRRSFETFGIKEEMAAIGYVHRGKIEYRAR